jgi:hypothetical protein
MSVDVYNHYKVKFCGSEEMDTTGPLYFAAHVKKFKYALKYCVSKSEKKNMKLAMKIISTFLSDFFQTSATATTNHFELLKKPFLEIIYIAYAFEGGLLVKRFIIYNKSENRNLGLLLHFMNREDSSFLGPLHKMFYPKTRFSFFFFAIFFMKKS